MRFILIVLFVIFVACHPTSQRGLVVIRKPPPACPATPAVLAPAADVEAIAALDASGEVTYTCRNGAWQVAHVDTVLGLVSVDGIDMHHTGSTLTWNDASSATLTQAASATVSATSQPWLLWNVSARGPIAGQLSSVTQVQRLSTTGGVAPTASCGTGNAGQAVEVPATSRYYLYRPVTASSTTPYFRCGGS